MKSIAVVISPSDVSTPGLVSYFSESPVVNEILVAGQVGSEMSSLNRGACGKIRVLESAAESNLAKAVETVSTPYLLLIMPDEHVRFGSRALERMMETAADSGAGLVYSDFRDDLGDSIVEHPLIDYTPGSARDSFDFGPVLLVSTDAVREAVGRHGHVRTRLRAASIYDLRLKVSVDSPIIRIPEPLYSRVPLDRRASGERQFDYVDPGRRDYQIEMETIFTDHLKRTGCYLPPEFDKPTAGDVVFPVRASIIIPVRNRKRTVGDAIKSGLSQRAGFEFNVIVVDNHSDDGTTELVADLSARDGRLVHLRPDRKDLGIGGCWNEAIYSKHCGEYAVQLDSDDLYAGEGTLERIVGAFEDGGYAMVIGSYTVVDFNLHQIPPGLIDHREWTRENGRNNALRINGLGAPRAFYVPVLREVGFPNTSYGEDYAVALRLSRRYEIGRIYEPVYLARRWEENSDAALPLATANRYDAYKDHLRTIELLARRSLNVK